MADWFIKELKKAGIEKLDYIIANHGEQDHSGALPKLSEVYPDAQIITNPKCKALLIEFCKLAMTKSQP
ncbi:MAG: hypothetical protein MZV70_01620 [Desulfobacterales bacterium]|nr:hypothetical protein [Desulfobacterales bacterium]